MTQQVVVVVFVGVIVAVVLPLVSLVGLRAVRAWRYGKSTPNPALASLARAGLHIAPGIEGHEFKGSLNGLYLHGTVGERGITVQVRTQVRGVAHMGKNPRPEVDGLSVTTHHGLTIRVRPPEPHWIPIAVRALRALPQGSGLQISDGRIIAHLDPRAIRTDLSGNIQTLCDLAADLRSR